jgi:DNA-binding LacI/PurR family transcriptional regulator
MREPHCSTSSVEIEVMWWRVSAVASHRESHMGNMKLIAKMAGVSLGTVSNVLNGSKSVREPLRKRVMDAVEAQGYQPSQLARGLRRDKTNVIAMIIPDVTNPFFPAVVRGAEDVAFSNGFRLILCNTDNDHSKELVHLMELRTYLPAGLIVIPSHFSDLTAQAESYRKSGTAVVCVDRLPKRWSGDTVTTDNEKGAYSAVSHVVRLGHKRLAAIVGPVHLTNSQERLDGFKRAANDNKISVGPEYIQETTFDRQGGYAKTTLLLRLIPRPTAIFAGNDLIALGALLAVRDAGLHCPNDISIMGFDDLDVAEMTSPPLSTVAQPGYQMGTAAAGILIDRIRGASGPARHVVIETALKLRHSVAPPPPKSGPSAPRKTTNRGLKKTS